MAGNIDKTRSYILPLIKACDASTVLDVGCGVGTMVNELAACGLDAYGVDLITLGKYWESQGFEPSRGVFVFKDLIKKPKDGKSLVFFLKQGVLEQKCKKEGPA
ncbi:methyltransferase domain-containing protein, partial [Methylophaga lonarensis]|uniref:methyltransferase domain-containing protein n=1 Tax=Methylophaga lonarensis TaxID=999151 RepID=UPI003D2C1733